MCKLGNRTRKKVYRCIQQKKYENKISRKRTLLLYWTACLWCPVVMHVYVSIYFRKRRLKIGYCLDEVAVCSLRLLGCIHVSVHAFFAHRYPKHLAVSCSRGLHVHVHTQQQHQLDLVRAHEQPLPPGLSATFTQVSDVWALCISFCI